MPGGLRKVTTAPSTCSRPPRADSRHVRVGPDDTDFKTRPFATHNLSDMILMDNDTAIATDDFLRAHFSLESTPHYTVKYTQI